MTVYALVKIFGGLPQGIKLTATEAEADKQFEKYTGVPYDKFYVDGFLGPDADEDYDGTKIFVYDDIKLLGDYVVPKTKLEMKEPHLWVRIDEQNTEITVDNEQDIRVCDGQHVIKIRLHSKLQQARLKDVLVDDEFVWSGV